MQLERIRLKSFGCFQLQDFELSAGINLIFGPNFSGKSTLVNAIFFTLTGKPILPRVDVSAIKNAKSCSGTAGLQFIENGEHYLLYRGTGKQFQIREKKGDKWHIVFDENRVTVVETTLKKQFGFSHDKLALTTFLREGEISEFLARQPATRRDILHALLGIDRLIEVRERFIDARRLAKRERQRIQSHQNSLRFKAQTPYKPEIEKLKAELKKLEKEYSRDSGDAELIAEWVKNKQQTQKNIAILMQEQKERLSGFHNISHLREIISTVEKAIQESDELEAERERLIKTIGSLDSQIAALTNVCDSLRTLIENDNRHCPTCQQKVEKEIIIKIVEEKETEKTKLSQELEKSKKNLTAKTDNLQSRQELEQRLQNLNARVSRLEQLEGDIDKSQKALTDITTRLSAKGIERHTDISNESIDDTTESAENIDKSQLKGRMDRLREKLSKLQQDEAVQKDRLNQLQQVNLEAEQTEKTTLCLELACVGVDKTIDTLQRQVLKPVESELQSWIGQTELFGKTDIDLQRHHLLPTLNIAGVNRSLMMLSGSEKMFLYLCFKVALAKVLGSTGFFVFDDPTLHLDGERKTLMVDFIRQLAEEYQVIVTSYDDDVREGLEGAHLIEMSREKQD